MKNQYKALSLLAALALSVEARATDGYFAHGYGIKSQGMGGVGIALPQDALAAATNPAGMAWVGNRADVGLTWFRPDREATISGTPGGFSDGRFEGNGTENFFIPDGGYNRVLSDTLTLGVSLYGNGGMNTDYEQIIPLLSGGAGVSGIDYAQMFVAPTITWKPAPGHAIGLAVNLGYQWFEAKGIENFTAISARPSQVTNRGHDHAFGVGVHIGWIGRISETVTLGASYQSRTWFENFDDYAGLFAGGGSLDAPASVGVGIAVEATPALTLAADVRHIFYSDIAAIGNPAGYWNGQPFLSGGPGNLGLESGPGFGWKDATVFKLGLSYAWSDALTLRAGYNHVTQPVKGTQALFNILAPGVVQDHLSLGATWTVFEHGELSLAYTHAFLNEVDGQGAIPPQFGGGNVKLAMSQNILGVAFGWRY